MQDWFSKHVEYQAHPEGYHSFVLDGVEVTMYNSMVDGRIVVEIDTLGEPDIRVFINDVHVFGEKLEFPR